MIPFYSFVRLAKSVFNYSYSCSGYKPEHDCSFSGEKSKPFSTPGFFPPSLWFIQRTPNEDLKQKLFPYKASLDGTIRSVFTGVAHISGKPVNEGLSYPTCNKVRICIFSNFFLVCGSSVG